MKRLFTAFLFSLFCLAAPTLAQTSKGFITGSVFDPNGALVPNASITVTNINTGAVRQTQSLEDGNYRFDAVDSGVYNLEVSAAGFDKVKNENIVVAAAQTVEINLQLQIAGAAAVVNVTAASQVELQSTDGGRTSTLERRQITDLPVAALNPVNMVLTLPGTIDVSQTKAAGRVQGVEFSSNGLRPRSNNQLIDGLDNNDNAVNGQAYVPTLRDGYNEVAVLHSNYSAEFGRAGGAVVNLITRSGTNDFHGSAFDIIENSAFNSLTPGQRRSGFTKVPHFTRNTFGGSLGGPVIKNKLFFFGTYQSELAPSSAPVSAVIPTAAGFNTLRNAFAAGKNANVDYYLGVLGGARGSVNPFTVSLGGNSPAVEFATASQIVKTSLTTHDAIGRLDFNPTERDNLTFRYLFNKMKYENQFPSLFEGYEVDSPTLIDNVYASYTRVFAPTLTNELRFGYGFMDLQFAPRSEAVGVEGPEIAFSGSGLGRGISGIGLNRLIPQGRKFNNFQFQDTVTYTVSNHTLRAGADLNFQRNKLIIPLNTRGSIVFTNTEEIAGTQPAATALENFARGFTGSGGSISRVFGVREFSPNVFYQNYFVNDEWRILDNLTVNAGLRYENYGTPFNEAAFPAFAGFNVPIDTVVKQKADNNNFAPRFSFAYTPVFESGFGSAIFGDRETVIRGGFAVNYDVFFSNMLVNTASASPNVRSFTALGQAAANSSAIGNTFVNQLPTTAPFSATAAITSIDPNLKNPEAYVYNFGIQRRFARNYVLDVAYVGSRGLKLFIGEQINPTVVVGAGTQRLNPSRGSVILRTNGGDSRYNSLQMRFERGYQNGFLFRSTYTYSKTIDNVGSDVYTHTGASPLGSNPFDRTADRGRASYDIPHAATVSGLWNLPTFGARGALGKIVNGFTLGAIYRVQSGAVENVYVGGIDLNRDGTSVNDRPAISNPNAPANSVAIRSTLFGIAGNGYVTADGTPIDLNNARYVVDRNLRTNIVGRNTLRAPLFQTLDVSFSRSFGLGFTGADDLRFQIRADFFNVLNHPNYAPGTGDVLSTGFNDPYTFGEGSARSGRIQLRFAF